MKITYDSSVDAAYVYMIDTSEQSEWTQVEFTYCCDDPDIKWMVNIDFAKDGRIFGIECIPGSILLDRKLIDSATKLDGE